MGNQFSKLSEEQFNSKSYESYGEYIKEKIQCAYMLLKIYKKLKKNNSFAKERKEYLAGFKLTNYEIDLRADDKKTGFIILRDTIKKFALNEFEEFVLICSIMVKIEKKFLQIFLKVSSEDEKSLSYETLFKIFNLEKKISKVTDYYKIISTAKKNLESLCFNENSLEIDDTVFCIFMNNNFLKINLDGVKLILGSEYCSELVIHESVSQKLSRFIVEKSDSVYGYLWGESGIGKSTIVRRAGGIMKKNILEVNLEHYSEVKEKNYAFIMSACRVALLSNSILCFINFDFIDNKQCCFYRNFVTSVCDKFSKTCIFISNTTKDKFVDLPKENFISIKIDDLTPEESFKMWESEFSEIIVDESVKPRELANKFDFTPYQIKNTCSEVKNMKIWEKTDVVNSKMIAECAYNQVAGNISDKAVLIKKKHKFEELVLPEYQKTILKRACNQIKYKHIVYEKWGLKERMLYGTGLSMLFTGPPGTGKTMAAQVVANELDLEIYKVDISKVVSKYIGETEKNLGEVFDSAKKSNVILLFDETDAIFGKRTEVKDSHDKHANLETAYLLQKIEEYNGITIMTTNLSDNLDAAFFRRINYVVHFNMPNAELRKEIWQKMYTKKMPLSKDIDFDYLSRQFEIAGGNIKNVVITSSFMAAAESKQIEMKHIVKGLDYELRKQGKMVSKSDFGEYSYLL